MASVRQFGNALFLALVSTVLVLGGLSLSLVEFAKPAPPTPTDVLLPSPLPLTATATFPPPLESHTPTNTALPTNTPPPPPSCQIPINWTATIVRPGDTLESIAARYRITAEELRQTNCLLTNSIPQGSTIYVPIVSTSTVAVCNPGAVGWVKSYRVQPNDTLYRIAINHYTTVALLKQVNCRSSDFISVGELLWVPNIPTRTATPSLPANVPTFTLYPTDPLTETALPFTLSPEPTRTIPAATPTLSSTPVATSTASVTAFPTPTTPGPQQ
jgi:LysM repeat protein